MSAQPSRAKALQMAALQVAARSGSLDLKAVAGHTVPFGFVPEIRPGGLGPTLLVGGVGQELVDGLTKATAAARVPLTIIEPDREVVDGLRERLRGEAIRVVLNELEDLRGDPDYLVERLGQQPPRSMSEYRDLQIELSRQQRERPLVADGSVSEIVLDGALNRMSRDRAPGSLAECHRALARGGRLVATVLLADERASGSLPEIRPWAPASRVALSDVHLESEILDWFARAGFYGIALTWRAEMPLKVVGGVELRGYVIEAWKGKEGVCLDQGHAVVYRGPWSSVTDDDGHTYVRGQRTAVCGKTFALLMRPPYAGHFLALPPYSPVPEEHAPPFDCDTPALRPARVTKGIDSVFDGRKGGGGACC